MRSKFLVGVLLMSITFVSLQSTYALSVQIQDIEFSYTMIYVGAYIRSSDAITISVTIQGDRHSYTVCPEQRVHYPDGSYGDSYGLMCNEVSIGYWSSSSTTTMTRNVHLSPMQMGTIEYKIHVFDSANRAELAQSSWRPVVLVIP
jgi:hypothetical protein